MNLRNLALTLLLTFCSPVWAAKQTSEHIWQDVERVVAVGDIHGAYEALVQLLQDIEIIDGDLDWSGGTTHFVSLGDLIDRGPDSRKVMDLLMRLQGQANDAGGKVHVLLGNHELMVLSHDYVDVSEADLAAYPDQAAMTAAFAPNGKYGSWLLKQPTLIKINDTVFAHGGINAYTKDIEEVNQAFTTHLINVLQRAAVGYEAGWLDPGQPLFLLTEETHGAQLSSEFFASQTNPLLGDWGPLWYRGTALCHAAIEAPILRNTLQALGATRVVIGHSPTPVREIVTRMDGQALLIDTGMLSSVYRGNPRALEITPQATTALPKESARIINLADLDANWISRLETAELVETEQGSLSAKAGQVSFGVTFTRANANSRRKSLAAMRLDRLLELGLVPATAIRQHNGKEGLLTRDRSLVLEANRQFNRINYCQFASEFDLVAAFDSLIGKTDRSADDLAYDPKTQAIVLINNGNAFPRGSDIPNYARPPTLPAGLREQLTRLGEEALTNALGDLLKKREITGILKRKATIEKWPEAR